MPDWNFAMPPDPRTIWLITGIILCLLEFVLPTAFVVFTMGASAILVGLLVFLLPNFGLQVTVWLALAVVLTILTRRLVPQRKSRLLEDSKEAETLTEISAGQVGRVLYEGNSWQARCGDEDLAIAPNQKVYVIDRRGTTLIVMPANLLNAQMDDRP